MNAPDPAPPPIGPSPVTPNRSLHWPWFLLALLLPPILTFATAMAGWKNVPVVCPFIGGGLAGLVCGVLLGRLLGKTAQSVVLLSLLFVCVFGALSFGLCFVGCLAGNYNLDMR